MRSLITSRRAQRSFIFGILILLTSQKGFAKCANMKAYYCTPAVFEKEMPDLNIGDYGKQYCSGSIALAQESVTAVFLDKEPCPAPGARLLGDLGTLCQDKGQWTNAVYWYSRKPDFCTRSYGDSFRQAQATAAKVRPGMTRAQARELLKDYVFLGGSFTEQYYLHPDIVLEVTFDEPNGAYSQDNKVKGPVVIKKTVMPQP